MAEIHNTTLEDLIDDSVSYFNEDEDKKRSYPHIECKEVHLNMASCYGWFLLGLNFTSPIWLIALYISLRIIFSGGETITILVNKPTTIGEFFVWMILVGFIVAGVAFFCKGIRAVRRYIKTGKYGKTVMGKVRMYKNLGKSIGTTYKIVIKTRVGYRTLIYRMNSKAIPYKKGDIVKLKVLGDSVRIYKQDN